MTVAERYAPPPLQTRLCGPIPRLAAARRLAGRLLAAILPYGVRTFLDSHTAVARRTLSATL